MAQLRSNGWRRSQHSRSKATRGPCVLAYHISPEAGIQEFQGQYSQKFGCNGIFMCKTIKAVRESWAGYVAAKRMKQPQTSNGKYKPRLGRPYANLTLYQIAVPGNLWLMAQEEYIARAQSAFDRMGVGAYGAWGWDEEVFIPEEYLPFVTIVGRETAPSRHFAVMTTRRYLKTEIEAARDVKRFNLAAREYLRLREASFNATLAGLVLPADFAKRLKSLTRYFYYFDPETPYRKSRLTASEEEKVKRIVRTLRADLKGPTISARLTAVKAADKK